jgi:hypothetical protein
MNDRDFKGLTDLEVIRLLQKKKKRFCAIGLNDLEELIKDKDTYDKVRKVFLDSINGYTRGVLTVLGLDIEGNNE